MSGNPASATICAVQSGQNEQQHEHHRLHHVDVHCDCKCISKRYTVTLLLSIGFMISFGINYLFGTSNIGFHTSFTPFFARPVFTSWNSSSQEVVDVMKTTFFWSQLTAQLPAGWLAHRYHATWIFGFSLASLGCINLLMPFVARMNLIVAVVARGLQGFAEAMLFPSCIGILRWWAPYGERSRILSLSFSGSHFGAVIFILLSRWAFDIENWEPLAYIFGGFAMIWHIFWVWMVFEKPSVHPSITQTEKVYIEGSLLLPNSEVTATRASPWCGIITSVPVYAIVVANVCYSSSFYLMLPEQRIDTMKTVFHSTVGDWAFVLHVFVIIAVICSGELSDLLTRKKVTKSANVRKALVAGVFITKAVAILVTVSLPHYTKNVVVFPLLVFFLSGFDAYIVWAVLYLNCLEIAPKYATILVAGSNFFSVSIGLALWKSTQLLCDTIALSATYSAFLSWLFAAALLLMGAVFYCVFASTEIQPWALSKKRYESDCTNEPVAV